MLGYGGDAVVVGYGLRVEGCGLDGRVEVSLLREFGLEGLMLLAVCFCVCAIVLTHSVWGE